MLQLISILILFLFNASIQSPIEAKVNDFSIDLIHRDSPLSPFYNHAATPSELMRNAALRSLSRAKFFHSYTHNDGARIETSLSLIGGEYVLKFHIGTPPIELFAMADTGSNLIWVKCSHQSFFNPGKSATYENVLYDSGFCQPLQKKWRGSSNSCRYNHAYGDDSYTTGNLSTDTFYLYSPSIEGEIPFEEIVFGCSEENYLHDRDSRIQGVVGLGAGVLSLVSQLKTKIEPKFSYCLVHRRSTVTSKLKFGAGAKISDHSGIVSTPIILKHPPQYYHLSLESISIGKYSTSTSVDQGNIIIDSGTLFTVLHKSIYNDLKAIVIDAIKKRAILDGDAPEGYNLCYEVKSIRPKDLPEMVFHFTSARIHLPWQQTFARCSDSLICMTIVPDDRLSIFGSRAQVNFQVEYDLQNLQVSFARADCTTFI